ncbi:hypothetical protein NQZ68_010551 [Dissostichus eleginoides]|nr:hypothetical protein NQZ68_010551 [Dissostichus eleginoides]
MEVVEEEDNEKPPSNQSSVRPGAGQWGESPVESNVRELKTEDTAYRLCSSHTAIAEHSDPAIVPREGAIFSMLVDEDERPLGAHRNQGSSSRS